MDENKRMKRPDRNFPSLDLSSTSTMLNTMNTNNNNHPILVVQSPKTPTLSRKLKAVSLDSDPVKAQISVELSRDVSSMPNTPKRQLKQKQMENGQKVIPAVGLGSNLKRFASNTSISGSQTLKTLPEVMTLQDFSVSKPEPVRIKAKGLLERRGSNASLTIDLGSNSSLSDSKSNHGSRFNTTKSASNLNLSTFSSSDKCSCELQTVATKKSFHRGVVQQDEGGKMTRANLCKNRCYTFHKKCNCLCNFKCRRKSLSNENLYVPPCSFCQMRSSRECGGGLRSCKGCRRAMYPRQPELEPAHILSDDFKLHLQNIQYLQTAGSILTIADLKMSCELLRVPKLHQEFWEVPLNLQEKCIVSGTQSKNRYKGVLPNEHSRVHLSGSSGYIHANYIKGPDYAESAYIATQGPMEHTCEDFWEMIWSSQCKCIVMLTGLIEKGKSKCELYFPLGQSSTVDVGGKSYFYVTTTRPREKFSFDIKNTQQEETETVAFEEVNELRYGNYKVTFCKKEDLGECVIRDLTLSKCGFDSRKIVHYWFSNWQDHKMANPKQVLEIAIHILEKRNVTKDNNISSSKLPSQTAKFGMRSGEMKINRGAADAKTARKSDVLVPIVVHCSAGIGRTGCFLAILNGIRQLRSNFNVDILAILCSLRLNRGGMVQTAEQYELIHRVLSLYSDRMSLC